MKKVKDKAVEKGKDFLSYYHYHKFDKKYGYCFESSNGFQGLIYNKTVFEKEGITELPKTLDEFYTICDQFKTDGITPIAIPSDTWVPQIWMPPVCLEHWEQKRHVKISQKDSYESGRI